MRLERWALPALLLCCQRAAFAGDPDALPHPRLDFGGELNKYTDNGVLPADRNIEASVFAQLGSRVARDLTLAGGVEVFRNFGLINPRFNVESYWHAAGPLDLYARVAATAAPSDKQFLPQWEATLAADLQIAGPLTLLAQGSHRYYTSNQGSSVEILQPGLRLELGAWTAEARAAFGFLRAGLGDPGTSQTGTGKLTWAIRPDLSVWLGGSGGREAQHSRGGVLAIAPVRSVFAGTRFALDPKWAMRVDLTFEGRDGVTGAAGYLRAAAALAWTRTF